MAEQNGINTPGQPAATVVAVEAPAKEIRIYNLSRFSVREAFAFGWKTESHLYLWKNKSFLVKSFST